MKRVRRALRSRPTPPTRPTRPGASIVHIHARSPKSGDYDGLAATAEDFYAVNKLIRERCPDIIINHTGSNMFGAEFDEEKMIMFSEINGTNAILLSGFLGSGKTTLLNHILDWKGDLSDTVLIMNEFGDVSIDGMLVDPDVQMVELVNGCICCTLQLDLRKQIETMVADYHPRWLIMEATGLADSGALIDVFAEYTEKSILSSYRLLTVMDVQVWPMRELLGPVFTRQLECADLLLLNKLDTMAAEAVEACMAEVAATYPRAVIEPTTYCRIDMDRLRGMRSLKSADGPRASASHHHLDSTAGWTSLTFVEARPLDEEKFKRFMENLGRDVFRLKGVLRFPDRAVVVNHVNGASEWSEAEPAANTKLAIIGRAVDLEKIEGDLKLCIAR